MSAIQVVIVSRDLLGMLRSCVHCAAHAAKRCGVDIDLTVVDNSSRTPYIGDDFVGETVECIRLDTHHSFAKGCNLAVARSDAECILLLNNDVFLHTGTLAGMLEAMSDPRIGICGAGLMFADGTIQHAGVVFGAGTRGPYHAGRTRSRPPATPQYAEVQAVTGACMLVRREVYAALNGLDESYPFGLEDIDFCLRARQLGIGVTCFLGDFSLHYESTTDGRVELDVPSRQRFMARWAGKYTIDG